MGRSYEDRRRPRAKHTFLFFWFPMTMQLNFQALLLLGLPAALLLAGGAQASLYGEDVRYTQCRASINNAPYLFGPPTASAQPISAAPQECSFLFPGRNNYAKGEETVLGSFIAPDCGSCAAACAASYYSVTEQPTIGPFTYMDEVVKEEMTPSALTDFKSAILNSVETCTVCTDWNYCSPKVAVVTESTSLRQEPGPNGTFYYVPEDPFFGSKCAGRVSGTTGETEPYGYQVYGPDLCLVKSTTGCNNPTSDRQVPPGTCTLKFNPKTEVKEHFRLSNRVSSVGRTLTCGTGCPMAMAMASGANPIACGTVRMMIVPLTQVFLIQRLLQKILRCARGLIHRQACSCLGCVNGRRASRSQGMTRTCIPKVRRISRGVQPASICRRIWTSSRQR